MPHLLKHFLPQALSAPHSCWGVHVSLHLNPLQWQNTPAREFKNTRHISNITSCRNLSLLFGADFLKFDCFIFTDFSGTFTCTEFCQIFYVFLLELPRKKRRSLVEALEEVINQIESRVICSLTLFFCCIKMSSNGKTTREKGGRDPPDVSLDLVIYDLLSYFRNFTSLDKAKKEVENKYDIHKEHDNCWPADDIKRAWGKTQRMEKTSYRRQHWTLVIMMQVMQKQRAGNLIQSESRSSQITGGRGRMGASGNLAERCAQLSMNDTSDQMKASTENKRRDDGLQSTSVNPKRKKVISEDSSSQITGGRVEQHSETIYIHIPLFVMFHTELFVAEQFRTIQSHLKLKDGLPGPMNSEIMKRKSYVMSFNHQTRNADWVYEILNVYTLAENPVDPASFGHGYKRGHLAAAANHRWCQEASNDADLFTNIVPQHQTLNNGPWVALENECRRRAENNICNIHVYSGPLYLKEMDPPVIQGKRVPSHFFKVIIEEDLNGRVNRLDCHKTPNGNLPEDPLRTDTDHHTHTHTDTHTNTKIETKTKITIEDIQQYSGLTFIERRPNVGQNAVANQITVTLHGKDGNTVARTAVIQVAVSHTP